MGAAPAEISVVIPTYRRHDYVLDAVASVVGQTVPAVEVIVVSDGPDPDLGSLLAATPVRYLEAPHGGVAAARNAGIAAARGAWIAFLDDDNLWHPEFVESVSAFLAAHPEVRALNTHYWTFSAPDSREGEFPVDIKATRLAECMRAVETCVPVTTMGYLDITGRSFDLLLEGMRGCVSSAVVRRDLILRAGGFPNGQTCAEDWTMFVNVAREAEWHVLPRRLAFLRIHEGNNSSARAVSNGTETLRAIAAIWADRTRPWPPHRPLRSYAPHYRFMLASSLATAAAARRWDAYRQSLALARHVLGPVDLLRAALPRPLAHRLRKVRDAGRIGRTP